MTTLRLRFIGEPVPKRTPYMTFRGGHIRSYPNKRNTVAKAEIVKQLKAQLPEGFKMISGPIAASVVFTRAYIKHPKSKHPMTRPDLDNYLKQIWDALNGLVFEDDAQIVFISAAKVYDAEGRIDIVLETVDENETVLVKL